MVWIAITLVAVYALFVVSFIFFQEKFLFRPKKLKPHYEFKHDVPFRELNLAGKEDATLNALHITPEDAKGIVLFFHGNWENLSNYLPYTKKFTEQGYSVLIPDYRGFGKSTGILTEELFFSDAELFYEEALKHFSPEKIILYGRSLGTGAASWLAQRKPGRMLILETPYSNLYDIAKYYGLLIPQGNYLKFGFRNDEHLKHSNMPVYIFHGTRDETVSIRSARKLKRFLKEGDRFIEIEGGKHKNLDRFELYHSVMDQLLR